MEENVTTDGHTSLWTEGRTCHSLVRQSNFLEQDGSSSSLHICPSVPLLSNPRITNSRKLEKAPKYGGPVRTHVFLVGVCGGLKDKRVDKKGRRKGWWRQRCYVTPTGSALNFFGLPTYSQAGLGHKGLREWAEGGWGKVEKKEGKFCDILIRESREWAGDLETLNSSCLLKSRTLFFSFYSVPQPLVHLFLFFFSLFLMFLLQFVLILASFVVYHHHHHHHQCHYHHPHHHSRQTEAA